MGATDVFDNMTIADLLSIVNETHQSILSDDVLEHFGETRNPSGYYTGRVRFSTEIEPETDADIGTTLKTAKGSPIKRNGKYGVGKEIGGRICLHEQYAEDVIPTEDDERAQQIVAEE